MEEHEIIPPGCAGLSFVEELSSKLRLEEWLLSEGAFFLGLSKQRHRRDSWGMFRVTSGWSL